MILYAGSYTELITENFGGHGEGIYCFNFDCGTGDLHLLHSTKAVNPSYLSIPAASCLYTMTELTETKKPRVQAYQVDPANFSLQLINEQEIPGGFPCYINYSVQNKCVLVACYETGNTIIYPVAKDGGLLPFSTQLQNEGKSINAIRQERAHAHAVIVDEVQNLMLVADLGIDKIMVYHLDKSGDALNTSLVQELALPPGSGPRHIAMHAPYVFILNELTGTVTIALFCRGLLERHKTFPALPENFRSTPGAAAIRASADGRFIYTSERSDNCIAVLQFESGSETLNIIQRQATGGKTPRDIILDPTGNWLLAANQDSDTIALFRVDNYTGKIHPSHIVENIKSPVCFAWLQAGHATGTR